MPSARAAEAARQSLNRLYGAAIELRYHDMDDEAERADHAEELALFAEEGWRLPVTLLNGEVLFVGRLQPTRLVSAVAQELARSTPGD
jgi:hypothetical protein